MRNKAGQQGQIVSLNRPLCCRYLNRLCFQQHSRLKGLSTFVFIHIPASFPNFPQQSFVFIDIPASFPHFLNSARFFPSLLIRHLVPRAPFVSRSLGLFRPLFIIFFAFWAIFRSPRADLGPLRTGMAVRFAYVYNSRLSCFPPPVKVKNPGVRIAQSEGTGR
jgi:hypothetical protein